MFHPFGLVSKIRGISPSRESWVEKPPEETPATVTVTFDDERIGLLETKNPRAAHWANILEHLEKEDLPVYVEIDPETGYITQLFMPEASKVRSLEPQENGDLLVHLSPSHTHHYLRKKHGNFDTIRNILQTAIDEKSWVLVTETLNTHEIVDVISDPKEHGGSSNHNPPPDPPVSEDRAMELFNEMKALTCAPCNPQAPCIPFNYPDDGCYARAHEMCRLMSAEGPRKVWIYGTLRVPSVNYPYCIVPWSWHVAPTLTVTTSGGDATRVIDPSLCDGPVSPESWKGLQGDPDAELEETDCTPFWSRYDGYAPEDDIYDTEYYLQQKRNYLKQRCDNDGGPPYSCVRACSFILDRSTFSKHEIEALLLEANPAVIYAAFYVVLDGHSPDELGITSEASGVAPNIQISPAVTGMSVQKSNLTLEHPDYLDRRQRMTWTYQVEFANANGFNGIVDELVVTLTATIAAVSASAQISLIIQANPYELDGPESWISTDLRVFQLKEGESKFGASVGSNPTNFIQDIIGRLNTGNTAGQTFEADLSTDYQASCLEL
ncbi:MAG: protein-glutamine glutaminase family protein, partial [Candidatus Thorarchaeota archaeon]